MMTCRCAMCGMKNADSNRGRGSYVRAGVRVDELRPKGADKRLGRRLRRRREARGLDRHGTMSA